MKIAILGGTGSLGKGLGSRWIKAGHEIIIGSRDLLKAQEIADQLGLDHSSGMLNIDAAKSCEIACLTVPFAHQESTLLSIENTLHNKKITYHDPCFLGRANNEYNAPRNLIKKIDAELAELKRCKSKALCCGAGGAQMFKEPEKGNQDINIKRSEEAIKTDAKIVAVSCPFCSTMMSDGMTSKQKEIDVVDIAQMIEKAEDL